MLNLLRIKNIALIDELAVEFGPGLNLLTGETGSGKSIIVDSLGALTGERVSGDLIKDGESSASIEGLFSVPNGSIRSFLEVAGIVLEENDNELLVRRELSISGKNRVFVAGALVTQAFLRRLGALLVDIHGQGEHAGLYDVANHLGMLDEFADVEKEAAKTAAAFTSWERVRAELLSLERDSSEKLQLIDTLRFQAGEIANANLQADEEPSLAEEKLRLTNVEKLTALSGDAYDLLYENAESTSATLEKAERKITELSEFESKFADYAEGIASARAVVEDLAFAVRVFKSHLEFSPARLDEIENRLAEILRLKRKYGGTVEAALEHFRISSERLTNIETAEFRQEELKRLLSVMREEYLAAAHLLSKKRKTAGADLSKQLVENLKSVALEKARFDVKVESDEADEKSFTANGFDKVEFYFSANPGESLKPLARVVSGGEASRLMLILKTTVRENDPQKTAVFDEVDAGIGGRVAESVGRKLKDLAANQQVLCVTHQPQIASLADKHFLVDKTIDGKKTKVEIRELEPAEQIEEIARMLAGERITDAARENAKSMLAAAGQRWER